MQSEVTVVTRLQTAPPHQLAGVSGVQVLGPAALAMEHFLADKVVTLRVAVGDVGGERGLAGPVRVSLCDELGVDGGVRPHLLHHHRPPLLTQHHRPAQLLTLLSEVELDICRGRNNMSSFIDCKIYIF